MPLTLSVRMGATAPPLSPPLTQRGSGRRPGDSRSMPRNNPDPGQVRHLQVQPRGRETPVAGITRNQETRMAKGESVAGTDVPAGGFVQLLTPDGERVDSVTTADGTTYSVDFTDE